MNIIEKEQLEVLYVQARKSERKRSHYLLHRSHNDKVQRLLIAMLKGSYVEPHYHELEHQWEMFVVLEGCIKIKTYASSGKVLTEKLLGEDGVSLVELAPQEIHSVECVSERALLLEVKEGPFDPNFAKVLVENSCHEDV